MKFLGLAIVGKKWLERLEVKVIIVSAENEDLLIAVRRTEDEYHRLANLLEAQSKRLDETSKQNYDLSVRVRESEGFERVKNLQIEELNEKISDLNSRLKSAREENETISSAYSETTKMLYNRQGRLDEARFLINKIVNMKVAPGKRWKKIAYNWLGFVPKKLKAKARIN